MAKVFGAYDNLIEKDNKIQVDPSGGDPIFPYDNDIDLSKIYIRAEINGKWDTYSIEELYDMATFEGQDAIKYWFIDKVLASVGLKEGDEFKKAHLKKAIENLEKVGVVIYKLK